MPFGPGTYGPMGGGGMAAPAPSVSDGGMGGMGAMLDPQTVPDQEMLSELVQMLKGGQAGAEKLLQLLSLMAQQTLPEMGAQQQGQQPDIQSLLG